MSLSRSPWQRAFATVAALVLLVTPPIAAQAQAAHFAISADSGVAGTLVTASVVDHCPATPPGQTQVVEIFFTDAAGTSSQMGLGLGDHIQTDQDGHWLGMLSLQPPHHQLVDLDPVEWEDEAALGLGQFTAQCVFYEAGIRAVTQDYAPMPFTITGASLRFDVSPSRIDIGGTIHLRPVDPCPAATTSAIAVVENWLGSYLYEPLVLNGGMWQPVNIKIPTTFKGGAYQVVVICDRPVADFVFTYSADALLKVARPYVYVSLGDSYSSGEGNPVKLARGCRRGVCPHVYDLSANCHRSSNGWPSLFAKQNAAFDRSIFLACSGASATDALLESFKGEAPQIPEAGAAQPDLLTITIGGNDIGFRNVLEQCVGGDCSSEIPSIKNEILLMATILKGYYEEIRAAVPYWTHIVIVGYPRLFPLAQDDITLDCRLWLQPAERQGLNEIAELYDQQMSDAAAGAYVDYVSTLNVLNDHELCHTDSWVNPIRPFDDGAAHPNKDGQKAIKKAVANHLSLS